MALLKKNKKFLGKLLFHRRRKLGLTLKDISKKVGKSITAISKWESNKYGPSPKSLFLLSKTLKVESEYFYEPQK